MGYMLTLEVPEDVYESLLKTAEQTGQRPETLAVQWLAQATKQEADDPIEQFIGAINSQGSDWAVHHDEYLGRAAIDTNHPPRDKE